MTRDEYNAFCRALPATTHVVQWGGSHVWKVGGPDRLGKVFAVGVWDEAVSQPRLAVSFKVSPIAYEVLKDRPGLRPAPYLASRGLKWIQHYAKPGFTDAELADHIRASHALVAQGLSKKLQRELGLLG